MGQKIKPRQARKPRNMVAYDAIFNHKGGPHRDRREKRGQNPRKSWENDHGV